MKYSQKVLDHFMKPHNVGKIENADVEATEGSPACGDQVSITMNIDENTHIIKDIKFQSYGCASNIATASIITDMAVGKTLEEAKKVTWKEAAEELDGLPPAKMHCSVLAVDTLRAAIEKYEVSHSLQDEKVVKLSKETIVDELRKVIYPEVGEDIVTLKMVKYIGIEKNNVIIDLDVAKFDTYRDNLAEEVQEHLDKFTEIENLEINL
ncbi:MAG: iron-sulfur cluster assembly scaffold protein [Candidatus Cloacimonadota bacterium]|nr:iron-sulfur cluster assembly scaffold protein [Candidatus Cloacimonadota bacterium]